MRYLLFLTLLVCNFSVSADSFTFDSYEINPVIGMNKVKATVVFHTDKYNVESCLRNKNPDLRKGFSVAQIEGTNTISYLCGTKYKRGNTVYLNIPKGI